MSISFNAINSTWMDQKELSWFIRNGYKTKMQIRHAKSSRLFCETWNKIVILQRAKYLLIVNSFPEIYYYYYHYFVVVLFFISGLNGYWPSTPHHVDCCHCQRSIDLICSDAKLALSLFNTNEMPMKPIKFCCCLLFYVIRLLFRSSSSSFSVEKPSALGNATTKCISLNYSPFPFDTQWYHALCTKATAQPKVPIKVQEDSLFSMVCWLMLQ